MANCTSLASNSNTQQPLFIAKISDTKIFGKLLKAIVTKNKDAHLFINGEELRIQISSLNFFHKIAIIKRQQFLHYEFRFNREIHLPLFGEAFLESLTMFHSGRFSCLNDDQKITWILEIRSLYSPLIVTIDQSNIKTTWTLERLESAKPENPRLDENLVIKFAVAGSNFKKYFKDINLFGRTFTLEHRSQDRGSFARIKTSDVAIAHDSAVYHKIYVPNFSFNYNNRFLAKEFVRTAADTASVDIEIDIHGVLHINIDRIPGFVGKSGGFKLDCWLVANDE
ncbi:7936_t:CDS:10 [Dentiscutata erythropus]|uniref:7936_t:CDS:1 n=1 Tax=Dentiscutata erythropus TaxID=1348616 RepID=A0A9N9J9V4_9GLOM|nr:7936_t:CDS:10 [Dentiscutata erythropus]